ncbi:hypothetical protein GWN15_17380, partial [candidate division KSB1 bacterium]|nr:hypothetical protein [candidate division KSB1 bacterium]
MSMLYVFLVASLCLMDISVAQTGWFWQNPLPQGNDLRDVSFIDANTGIAVGIYGTIIRTTDGGVTWSIQNSGTTQPLYAVSLINADTGTAVGDSGT